MAVPVDQISAEARHVNTGRAVLTALAAVLYAVGWVVGKLILVVVWATVAVKLGYREARQEKSVGSAG